MKTEKAGKAKNPKKEKQKARGLRRWGESI